MDVKDLILRLAHATRTLASTHIHWHLSNGQETMLKDLDELIHLLENPVENTPVDSVNNNG